MMPLKLLLKKTFRAAVLYVDKLKENNIDVDFIVEQKFNKEAIQIMFGFLIVDWLAVYYCFKG